MLSSNQIPYDLSRRKSDQFYAKVVRESPFDTIVFIFQDRGVRCQYFEGWCGGFPVCGRFTVIYTDYKHVL